MILEGSVSSGGGFNQAVNAIIQMKRLSVGRYEYVVFTTRQKNIEYLNGLGCNAKLFNIGFTDRWLMFSATRHLFRRLQARLGLCGNFEKSLLNEDVDIAYFVEPNMLCLSLQQINYITTVWDLCHRDTPEFPEVRKFSQFLSREYLYANTLAQALFVITDSNTLAEKASFRYGIDKERFLNMPFSPTPFASESYSTSKNGVLTKYSLSEGYYFYPAQFWAHKNHVRILQALKILKEKGIKEQAVFCGVDHGNLSTIKSIVVKMGLENQVQIIGFVPAEDIHGLYQGCSAVVMPTYFGPTNLPPLEAWKMGKPLIYSSHLAEHSGGAALSVNPDSAIELAEAMRNVLDPFKAEDLVKRGYARLAEIDQARKESEQELIDRLGIFSLRLECWNP